MDYLNSKTNVYNKKHIKNKTYIFYIKKKPHKSIEYLVHQKFIKKYIHMSLNYNKYITNNIIFNEKTHLVSIFKEYLIIDDEAEFLKRYYKKDEILTRLPKFFEFYFLYSKLFPNYTSILENKFLYNNIHQKQKMIEYQEKMEKEKNNKKMEIEIIGDDINVFSTDILNSLLNSTNKEGMEIIFDVKKDKLTEEENNFKNGINHIVDEINDYQNKKNIFINLHSINSKYDKIKKNNNIIFKNLNSNKENISHFNNNILLQKMVKNPSKKKIESKNIVKELKNHIINNRNKNNIKNYLNKKVISNNNKNKNSNKSNKIINDRFIKDKMEKELFKMRKKYKKNKNFFSQNISTSIQTKKEYSLSKKNISLLNNNSNSNKNSLLSTLLNIPNISSSKGISSSNSFIKEIKEKKFHKNRLLLGNINNNELQHHKSLKIILNNNKDLFSRNKELKSSSTTKNIFNNIIKYRNKNTIDSNNKNIFININSSIKTNSNSFSNRNKKVKNNKIIFNNFNNKFEYATQNNKEFDLKNKIKKLKYNKSINNINLENNNIMFNKSINEKNLKTYRYSKNMNKSNINSAKNLFINTYKKIDKKTIENNNLNNERKNIGRNYKDKLIINCTHTKTNLTNKSINKNNSSYKNITTNINSKKKKIYYLKMNNFLKMNKENS